MQIVNSEIENLINSKIEQGTKEFGENFKNIVLEIIALEKMTKSEPKQDKKRKLIPLSKWNDYHPTPAVGTLRQRVFHDKNFEDYCIERDGRTLLIDEDKYFEYQLNKGIKND